MNKPTIEALNVVNMAVAILTHDAMNLAVPTIKTVFGEEMDHDAQVAQARANIACFASVYCKE